MIEEDRRKAIFLLHQEGMPLREIARRLHVARATVATIIRQAGAVPKIKRSDKLELDEEVLRDLYALCDGYVTRVHEKLLEKGIKVAYTTLTERLRQLGISVVSDQRCDEVPDEPGLEMQHDTSPYGLEIGGRKVPVVGSLLYLRYSKRRYLIFYRRFNRFRMQCFFHEALTYWQYSAPQCIIDNTNLARLPGRGTGKDAVIVPEMEAFGLRYGFRFLCHAIGHADRKAGEERSFLTVETNFFPGRTFASLEDLNAQALEWATVRMETKVQGKTRVIPAKAFEHERQYLQGLTPHLPAPYLAHERDTDQYGYAAFDGNYYWIPGTERKKVKILEYSERLKIYLERELIAEYPLPPDGIKNEKFSPPGGRQAPPREPQNRRSSETEEKHLRCLGEALGAYLDFALGQKGIQRHLFIRRLLGLSRRMSAELFIKSIERAHKYRIVDLATIERIASLHLAQAELPLVEVDPSFTEREAYREGAVTDLPDLSKYEEPAP